MSTNKTQNYQLHGWAPEDEHPRSELNANFTKLDTALKAEETARIKATPRVVTGVYTGTSHYNLSTVQAIQLGFRPRMVCIMRREGDGDDCSLFMEGHPTLIGENWIGQITATGFEVKNVSNHCLNDQDHTYHYFAIV